MRTDPQIKVELASMTTEQGVKHWCSELYLDGRFEQASDWSEHVTDAIDAGRDLELAARSDLAYREARWEVAQLYARAS